MHRFAVVLLVLYTIALPVLSSPHPSHEPCPTGIEKRDEAARTVTETETETETETITKTKPATSTLTLQCSTGSSSTTTRPQSSSTKTSSKTSTTSTSNGRIPPTTSSSTNRPQTTTTKTSTSSTSIVPASQQSPTFDGCAWNVPGIGKFSYMKNITFEDGMSSDLQVSSYKVDDSYAGAPYDHQFYPENVYVDDGLLCLKVPGQPDLQPDNNDTISSAEVITTVDDMKYCVVESEMAFDTIPGVCHGKVNGLQAYTRLTITI